MVCCPFLKTMVLISTIICNIFVRNQAFCRFSLDLSPLMDEVFMRNQSRGISLINNSQSESNEMKTSVKNLPKSELFRNMRKKSEMRKRELLSCTESEREETLVDSDR